MVLVVLFLVFTFLLFHLASLNKTDALKESVALNVLSKDSDQLLLNYLRAPFEPEGTQNIADAIADYFLIEDKDSFNQLKSKTDDHFSKSHLVSDYSTWSLDIEHSGRNGIEIESKIPVTPYRSKRQVSTVVIPTNNENSLIEIKLFSIQTS
ncbi:MAG: hypothetical protein QF917_00100 [Candidatus Woesearchaeota archaeon]|nr:hypothetical protein [Candidatus Woesearchaeota archaeon]